MKTAPFLFAAVTTLAADKPGVTLRKAAEKVLTFDGGKKGTTRIPCHPSSTRKARSASFRESGWQCGFEKEGDRLIKPRLVTDAAEEEGCVIFDCKHRDGFLSLKVVNPYPQELHYRCGTIQHGREDDERIEGRRNLPVPPNLMCFESYTGTEIILFFKGFELKKPEESKGKK